MTEQEVQTEVRRLQMLHAQHQREALKDRKSRVQARLRARLEAFKQGRLRMCACPSCLAAYVACNERRLCAIGHEHFYHGFVLL
jgi:hypothetical protein